jgi:hypothetical protein
MEKFPRQDPSRKAATAGNDALIRCAIAERRLIRFEVDGLVRIAEPHDYGIRKDVPQLLAYQTGGQSKSGKLPNWRWFVISRMSNLEILSQSFAGGRPSPSGKHSAQELFLRVEGARRAHDERR